MFPSTQPMDVSDSWPPRPRPEAHRQPTPSPSESSDPATATATATGTAASEPGHTALSSLSPSLLQDLQRFDPASPQRELLEVLAACIRHTQPLAIDLAWGASALTLSVFPLDRMVHCPLPLADFLAHDLGTLQVRQVRPALLRPPADALKPGNTAALAAGASHAARYAPLGPLLWTVALRGARAALLPELAGPAAYRVAPGISLTGLDVPGTMAACITRLRRQTCNLADIAGWPDVGPERATRLLNALYLQSGLIVSRSHPAATIAGWTGYGD